MESETSRKEGKRNRSRESGIVSEENELDGARSREKAEPSQVGLSDVGELYRIYVGVAFLF